MNLPIRPDTARPEAARPDAARPEEDARSETPTDWNERPLDELVDHILVRFHQPLWQDLSRLEAMARKVRSVHGSKDPERLERLAELVSQVKAELEMHLQKEERVLFPWIKQGVTGARLGGPVQMMLHEHDSHDAHLAELRRLTNDYAVPAGACNTWRGLWTGLARLDSDLRAHIQLENDVLFRRVLGA